MKKLFIAIVFIGIFASFFPGTDTGHSTIDPGLPNKATTREVNFSLPIYTQSHAIVCPIGILFDRRESIGIEAATRAATKISGRSKAIEDSGCQEWKSGQRLYITDTGEDLKNLWLKATPYANEPAELLVMKHGITNNSDGSP